MSSTTWAWGIPSRSPPSMATAPATCWTPALHTSPPRRKRKRTMTSSRWRSSASPTWGNPPSSTAFWGRSGSSSPTWRAQPGTPSTATMRTSRANSVSSTPPGCGRSPRWTTGSRSSPSSVPPWPSSAAMCASSSSTPRRGSPSRTPRWPVWPTRRARPASSWSTSGTPSRRTARPWTRCART